VSAGQSSVTTRPATATGGDVGYEAIRQALALLCGPADAIEIRAPRATRPGAKVPADIVRRFPPGAFDVAAAEAHKLSGHAPAVYLVMNGVKPGQAPAGRKGKGATTADIPGRRWLLIDVDPDRPADSSSTNAEKGKARKIVKAVRTYLDGLGLPAPVFADSGNGWHLLYRVDLPNDVASTELVKAALRALATRFDSEGAKIDRKVFDAPRLVKLYGTKACKGDDTLDRPHRFARIVEASETIELVSREQLEALAREGRPVEGGATPTAAPVAPPPARSAAGTARRPSVMERAVMYLAACQPAVEGDDGSGQTIKMAIKVGPGFGLTEDEAFHLLWEQYNPRCEPPWNEKDLRRKVTEAYKKETRRGWLLNADRRNGNGRNGSDRLPTPPSDPPLMVGSNGDGAGRPEILISTEEHAVIDQAADALAVEPDVFQRHNALVTVLRDPILAKRPKIHRPRGSPRIAALHVARLRDMMTKVAAWKKTSKDRNGDVDHVSAHPPDWAVNGLAARGQWPHIRPIEGIIEAPTIRPDGTILDRTGWDEETCLLYESSTVFPKIDPNPSREDARYAAEFLLELVVDFPFANDNHRAAWLAGLLTPLARFAIQGPCPLFMIDANTPGSGKSKLTDLISIVATGREMSRTAYPDGDEEMRKRITATALAGDRLVAIDNIATTFGGSSLDSALTATFWKDRKLGASEMTPEIPLFTVWYATGNNIALKSDVLRRLVYCRLEAPDERPEERSGWTIKGDLLQHVRNHRPELVAAALTLLVAHTRADRPDGGLTPMGSFEAWSDVVRSAVYWAIGVDPCATRAEILANDPESIARAALIEGWSALPGSHLGLTVAEAIRHLKADPEGHFTKLRDCLMEWSRNDELPSAKAIGKRLGMIRGRVDGGRALQSVESQGTQVWKVVTC
jgi:hypothetical protein